MIKFESGYLFGEYYGCNEYIICKCEPKNDNELGVVKYSYGTADYCRFTKKAVREWNELGKWQGVDGHWYSVDEFIDHHNMLCSEENCAIAETVQEALRLYILKCRENENDEPEVYLRKKFNIVYTNLESENKTDWVYNSSEKSKFVNVNDLAYDKEKWDELFNSEESFFIYTREYPYNKDANLIMEEFSLLRGE